MVVYCGVADFICVFCFSFSYLCWISQGSVFHYFCLQTWFFNILFKVSSAIKHHLPFFAATCALQKAPKHPQEDLEQSLVVSRPTIIIIKGKAGGISSLLSTAMFKNILPVNVLQLFCKSVLEQSKESLSAPEDAVGWLNLTLTSPSQYHMICSNITSAESLLIISYKWTRIVHCTLLYTSGCNSTSSHHSVN